MQYNLIIYNQCILLLMYTVHMFSIGDSDPIFQLVKKGELLMNQVRITSVSLRP